MAQRNEKCGVFAACRQSLTEQNQSTNQGLVDRKGRQNRGGQRSSVFGRLRRDVAEHFITATLPPPLLSPPALFGCPAITTGSAHDGRIVKGTAPSKVYSCSPPRLPTQHRGGVGGFSRVSRRSSLELSDRRSHQAAPFPDRQLRRSTSSPAGSRYRSGTFVLGLLIGIIRARPFTIYFLHGCGTKFTRYICYGGSLHVKYCTYIFAQKHVIFPFANGRF